VSNQTFNRMLFEEIYSSLFMDSGAEYTELDLGLCAFVVDKNIEIVCKDLAAKDSTAGDRYIISIACDGFNTQIEETFGSLNRMIDIFSSMEKSVTKVKNIFLDARTNYQKKIKLKFEGWRNGEEPLSDFLGMSDAEYLDFLLNKF
jgi:hypothetical protein